MGHGRIEAGLHWVANGVRFRGHGFKSRLHLSNSQIIDMNPAASARWHLLSAPLKMTSYIPVSGVSNPVLDVPNLLEIVVVAREWCLSAGTKPFSTHGRLTRYIMLQVAHAPGMAGTFLPTADFKGNSYPGMPHGTCVTHVPWCMSGSLTRGGGENVLGIPGTCARAILGIWRETYRTWSIG